VSVTADLASRLAAVYTAALADVLDRRGLTTQTLPPDLIPLRSGMRLAGPVYPIKGRASPGADPDASIRTVLEMLGSVPAGHVSVYESCDRESAHLGELSVISLKSRGVAGAVIDGGCRDVELIVREGFPVFSRYTTPQDAVGRWEVVAHGDVELEIGGVRLRRGDWILADEDGIVAIPAAVALDVVAEAEEKVATENEIRVAVRAGTTPLDAFEQYGTF
jgi:4-hydroxy-4-methyl-2-oxoglutarate aldolase